MIANCNDCHLFVHEQMPASIYRPSRTHCPRHPPTSSSSSCPMRPCPTRTPKRPSARVGPGVNSRNNSSHRRRHHRQHAVQSPVSHRRRTVDRADKRPPALPPSSRDSSSSIGAVGHRCRHSRFPVPVIWPRRNLASCRYASHCLRCHRNTADRWIPAATKAQSISMSFRLKWVYH